MSNKLTEKHYLPEQLAFARALSASVGATLKQRPVSTLELRNTLFETANLSMECAFVGEVTHVHTQLGYWETAARMVLQSLASLGLTTEGMYQVTHIILFATHFGNRNPVDVLKGHTISVYLDMLNVMKQTALRSQYWDLLLEIYISELYLMKHSSQYALTTPPHISTIPTVQGFYMPLGFPAATTAADLKNPYSRIATGLFHCTVVKSLLDIEFYAIHGEQDEV